MSERTSIGLYRVLRLLGQGGMGEVYLAEDPRLSRQVAIKVLGARALGSEEARRRFEREARTAAQLSHPNIVHIYEVGEDEGIAYLVMEHVEGRTLRDLIAEGALPVERTLHLAEGICDGLAAAHERGIVHRDIKPANILVDQTGRPRILDFGLAKALEPQEAQREDEDRSTISHITQARKVMGTVAYMSPEQAEGRALDHRSDLFSFGVLLYQMCTGHLPFEGDSDITTLVAILRDTPPALSAWSADVPPELERIIFRCLEKRPEDRYQSTRELCEDLGSLCRDADWQQSRTRTTEKMRAAAAELRARAGERAARSERRWRRVSALAAAAAAGLALVLFPLAGSSLKRKPPEPVLLEPPSAAVHPGSVELRVGDFETRLEDLEPQLEHLEPRVDEIRVAVEQAFRAHGEALRTLRGLSPGRQRSRGPVLAILGFRNHTGDPGLEWVSSGLPEILITDLSDLEGIRLVGTRKMSDLAARAGASWEKGLPPKLGWRLAREAGASLLLTGSLFKSPEGLRLDAGLEDVRSGTVVFSEKQLGTDIFELADGLTRALRERLGAAPAAEGEAAAASPRTHSAPAMAAFTRAMNEFNRLETAQAIPHLEQAVRLDPEFPLARLRLLQCYRQEGRRAEAREQLRFLEARKSRLGRKYAELVELYSADEQMSLERTLRAAERLTQDAGDDPEIGIIVCKIRTRIGKLLGDAAKLAEGLECLRQIYLKDPLFAPAVQAYAAALDFTEQRTEAVTLLAEYVQARPDDGRMRTLYAQALQNDNRLESAARELEQVVEQRPQDSYVLTALAELSRRLERFEEAERWLSRLLEGKDTPALVKAALQEAQLQAARGHVEAALGVAQKGSGIARQGGDPLMGVRLRMLAAELLLALGRVEEAWRLGEQILAEAPARDSLLAVDAAIFAWAAGQEERAEELSERAMEALDGDASEKFEPFFEQLLGLAEATALGNLDRAVELSEAVRRTEPESIYFPLLRLALAQGKVEWLAEHLRSWLARASDPSEPLRIYAHYFLGRAEEARGRRAEAREAYREFLHWWQDGDQRIAEIQDARQRLELLDKAPPNAPRKPG